MVVEGWRIDGASGAGADFVVAIHTGHRAGKISRPCMKSWKVSFASCCIAPGSRVQILLAQQIIIFLNLLKNPARSRHCSNGIHSQRNWLHLVFNFAAYFELPHTLGNLGALNRLSTAGKDSRLRQIVDWFGEEYGGVIVFDECHRAKNCVPKEMERGRVSSESKTSRVSVTSMPPLLIEYTSQSPTPNP